MNPNATSSITVDRALFEQFIAWQQAQEQEQHEAEQQPAPVPTPAPTVAPWPANTGTVDAHGFVPTTMQVTAHEGGRYGVAAQPEQAGQDAPEQGDPGDQQQPAPYTSPVTTPTRKRSSRVSPSVADAYVIETMKHYPHSNAFTIRPPRYLHSSDALTDDPKNGAQGAISKHFGVALSVAQVRAALDRLATAGRVYKHGKNGKQDRWYLSGNEHANPTH